MKTKTTEIKNIVSIESLNPGEYFYHEFCAFKVSFFLNSTIACKKIDPIKIYTNNIFFEGYVHFPYDTKVEKIKWKQL